MELFFFPENYSRGNESLVFASLGVFAWGVMNVYCRVPVKLSTSGHQQKLNHEKQRRWNKASLAR